MKTLTENQIREEAEKRFPIVEDKRAANGELYQSDHEKQERQLFIDACKWAQSQLSSSPSDAEKEAVDFVEWIEKKLWKKINYPKALVGRWKKYESDDKIYPTTSELYQLFARDKNG